MITSPVAARADRLSSHHEAMAPCALKLVQSLAGGYVKMGQVLSNRADVLPEAYVRAFGVLQDDVPQRPWARMRRALGPRLAVELAWVDPVALGAASTGQAHRARLRNGSEVVLKVQYADARASFGHDFANVARLAAVVLPALCPVINEVRRRFLLEFDYVREAHDMLEVRRDRRCRHIRMPEPYLDLTTERLLCMEYLPGEKLLTHVRGGLVAALGEAGYRHARARAMGQPPPRDAPPPSVARKLHALPRLWRLRARTRTHLRRLVLELGHQIFACGLFHADPHPCAPGGRQPQPHGVPALLHLTPPRLLHRHQPSRRCAPV